MKRVVRTSVFETNSSSMHSICIINNRQPRYSPSEITDNVYVWNDCTVHLYDDDLTFGRYPFQILLSLYEKVRYVIASYAGYRKKEDIPKEVTEAIDIFTEAYNDAVTALNDTDESGVELNYFSGFEFPKDWDGEMFYGYVDHQSAGLLESFLKDRSITLKEFLLNPRYVVVIDGDEYCDLDRYQKTGLLKELEEVYRW